VDALTLEEREEDVSEAQLEKGPEDLEVGLESLASKYGMDKIMDAVARMSIKD
jgi:benzoyl-CoA reductase subunit BamC